MITKLSHDGLRKAAILVASLDTAAADAVLDQLTPEQARQVREIVVELDNIDQSEQRRIIDEFTGQGAGGERGRGENGRERTGAFKRTLRPEPLPSARYRLVLPAPSPFL